MAETSKPKFCSTHLHYSGPSDTHCACGALRRGGAPFVGKAAGDPAPAVPPLQGVIDGRCFCAKCRERTENIYRQVSGKCLNCCAGPFLILYREGDPASAQECPRCKSGSRPVAALRPATDDEIPVAADAPSSPPQLEQDKDDLSRQRASSLGERQDLREVPTETAPSVTPALDSEYAEFATLLRADATYSCNDNRSGDDDNWCRFHFPDSMCSGCTTNALLDRSADHVTTLLGIIRGLEDALAGRVTRRVPVWLPISSAPKDGTVVIVWPLRRFAYFDAHESIQCWLDDDDGTRLQPTHWHPSPPLPSSVGQ